MISIKEAIKIIFEKFPDKEITSIGIVKDEYSFGYKKDDEYDSSEIRLNKNTGDISIKSSIDLDAFMYGKLLLNEEQVKELISSLAFDK